MRVIVAEDSVIVRNGLEKLLAAEGCVVTSVLSDAAALPALVLADAPDAVVLDIRMPPTHTDEGLRVAEELRPQFPDLAILVLSQYVVPEYATRLLTGGERGTGYLLKDRVLDGHQLRETLERLGAGGTVVDPELVRVLLEDRAMPLARLTGRELEVLQLVAEGMSDRGIAEQLVLSGRTVGTHIQHIFDKLDVPASPTDNRRVLATIRWLQHGSA